jgi:hypothetical protein
LSMERPSGKTAQRSKLAGACLPEDPACAHAPRHTHAHTHTHTRTHTHTHAHTHAHTHQGARSVPTGTSTYPTSAATCTRTRSGRGFALSPSSPAAAVDIAHHTPPSIGPTPPAGASVAHRGFTGIVAACATPRSIGARSMARPLQPHFRSLKRRHRSTCNTNAAPRRTEAELVPGPMTAPMFLSSSIADIAAIP